MKSKELSIPIKEATLALKRENKSLREIARALGVAKSTIWYILKKKECTGKICNIRRPGRPRKTPKSFTTSKQFRKSLGEVGAPMSKPKIKRCLDEYRVG